VLVRIKIQPKKKIKKKLSELNSDFACDSLILEFIFNSGKFKGKDSSEVPLGYLTIIRDAWNDPDTKYDLRKMKSSFSFEELEAAIAKAKASTKTTSTTTVAPTTTTPNATTTPPPTTMGKYIAGEAEKSDKGLIIGEKVIIEKIPDGWSFTGLQSGSQGKLSTVEIKGLIKSIRDEHDKPISSNNFDQLKNLIHQDVDQTQKINDEKNKHILPQEKLSEEQEKIDKKFEKIINASSGSHIVIRALAGSGKTTMLKHLAWKYGKPGQRWLYLVFNTKNKVEATEKFPPWVQVKTTNGFLGEILEHEKNALRVNQTKRMVDMVKGEEERIPSKIRILADSQEFKSICANRFGIPDENKINTRDKTTLSIIKSIRYGFKEEVIKLSELCKSFSINPNDENSTNKIKEVFEKYDIDSELSEVKKRISKYKSGDWLRKLLDSLISYLGYDIRTKNFEKEIIDCAYWLLKESMPGSTNITYDKRTKDGRTQKFKLSDYRDFTDDLWYASTNADKLHWPKYDFVLADEVQDFNESQKIMLRKLSESGAKIVAVGDENQSIYRFRGADAKAFNNLSAELSGLSQDKDVEHSLTTNYRSRPAIIEFVNNLTKVKNLKGKVFTDGDEGEVSVQTKEYEGIFDELKKENEDKSLKETAFIARTNAPLAHAALKLLTSGVPFVILGKDLAKDLVKHTEKIMRFKKLEPSSSVQELSYALQAYLEDETESHGDQSSKKAHLQELKETTEALLSCINQFSNINESIAMLVLSGLNESFRSDYYSSGTGGNTIQNFIKWLNDKLSGLNIEEKESDLKAYKEKLEKEHPVILTTSHKSKGLEFDRVFVLRDDQFPSPKAKRPEDLEQEENAKYVAYTRAKDQLHIVKLEGQPGYNKK
jgi:superfamily I DNA/RNA helicase